MSISSGTGKDQITMQVRRFGDVEKPIAGEELEALKRKLFDIAGGEFPLEITVRECCNYTAEVTGAITLYDVKQNRVLIVNEQKKNGNTDDP